MLQTCQPCEQTSYPRPRSDFQLELISKIERKRPRVCASAPNPYMYHLRSMCGEG